MLLSMFRYAGAISTVNFEITLSALPGLKVIKLSTYGRIPWGHIYIQNIKK